MRFLISFLILGLVGCKSSSDSKPLTPYEEVMAIHDKVMPELSRIHTIKRDLLAIADTTARNVILSEVKVLDEADEAMMSWMAAFKMPTDKNMEGKYLSDEKLKITKVSDQMYQAIAQASELLDSLQNTIKN
ncbi:MAG: hypothetical protein WAU01_11900 [Saprospiraceae bacterium]